MAVYGFGPRARRVYDVLRERIVRGEWSTGTRLPALLELAAEFGVAPMTVRQVLSRLEEEGLVSRQVGRGTFVQGPATAAVLVVDDEPAVRTVLARLIAQLGFRALTAESAVAALTLLAHEPTIALALVDLRLPELAEGIALVRAIRRRYPALALAALPTEVTDLAPLFGDADWPVLIVPTPVRLSQLEEVLRLALRGSQGTVTDVSGPEQAGR